MVLDASDVLKDPRGMLTKLCAVLGLEFSERMPSWPAGLRTSDGVWAKHWYQNVIASPGFIASEPKIPKVPHRLTSIVAAARPHYAKVYARRLR